MKKSKIKEREKADREKAEKRKFINSLKENAANVFSKELKEAATNAELHFKEVAERKGLNLEFQVPVYIKYKKAIQRFYIVDFMDKEHKIIFEIDGEYHDTYEQKKKDWFRTRDLNSLGYTVYRISNNDVFLGKTTAFLYKIYLAKGIDISKIM